VVEIAKTIAPSARGESEITAIKDAYLQQGRLHVKRLLRGDGWLASGTVDSMSEASSYVEVPPKRTGAAIGSPEGAAHREGPSSAAAINELAKPLENSGYGAYLHTAAREG